jgi:hypothetical protein
VLPFGEKVRSEGGQISAVSFQFSLTTDNRAIPALIYAR